MRCRTKSRRKCTRAIKAQGLRRCVEEIVFTYAYSRLDMQVSKHMTHLLKAPFCIHPKTGRVCVPINPDDCDYFDPTTVPTLSEALQQLPREKVQLATNFGIVSYDAKAGLVADGTPENVRSRCEASITRLSVENIDLYYQHRVDKNVPIEDTIGELKKLVEEGKVKYIGLSEASPDTIRQAHAVHPITAVQMEWSL